MNSTPPPLPARDSAKLKTEVGCFLIILGVILAAIGYWSYDALKGSPHDLFGISRNVALGGPVFLIGIIHLISGLLLFFTSSKIWAILGASASTLMAIFFLTFFVAATGKVPLNLISILIVIIPFGVWIRTRVFLRSLTQK